VFREGAGDLVARLQAVAANDQPGLIVIDTLQRVIKARDLNDYAEVTTKLTPILTLARETNAAVLVIHHAGKAARQDAFDSVLGSTALSGSVDNVFLLCRNDRYRTLQTMRRVGRDLPETILDLVADGQTRNGGTRQEADAHRVQRALLDALASGPGDRPALLECVEARRADKLQALKRLVDAGTITRTGTGKRGDAYTYALASPGIGGSRVPDQCGEPPTQNPQPAEFLNDSAPNGGSQDVNGSDSQAFGRSIP